MNALSQISQLVADIGEDKAKWFLQKCIDELEECKRLLNNPTELEEVICGKCEKRYFDILLTNKEKYGEWCECPAKPPCCVRCDNPASKKAENSDCYGECVCGYCSHEHYWNLCEECFKEEAGEEDEEDEEVCASCSATREYHNDELCDWICDSCGVECRKEDIKECDISENLYCGRCCEWGGQDDEDKCDKCGRELNALLECSTSAEAICIFCCDSEYCEECPKDREGY